MFASLFHTVNCLFCQHEWMTRSHSSRMYVVCVKCFETSQGIDIRREPGRSPQRSLPAANPDLSTGRLAA
jgi:hypothetical protein